MTGMQLSRKAVVLVAWLMVLLSCSGGAGAAQKAAPFFSYELLERFWHDPQAYTQGLVWDKNLVYESSGGFGSSSLRLVDPATGRALRQLYHDPAVFAGRHRGFRRSGLSADLEKPSASGL